MIATNQGYLGVYSDPDIVVGRRDHERLREVIDSGWRTMEELAVAEQLETELDRARIVDQDEVPSDVVTMGSRVLYEIVETGEERSIILSYPEEAEPLRDRISILSDPCACALIGLSEGEEITWPLPDGTTVTLWVKAVHQEADRESDD